LGPFSLHKLQNLWLDKKISSKTYVWNEDLKDWKYLQDIKEFTKHFQNKNKKSLEITN
jgi:hypothetical protein